MSCAEVQPELSALLDGELTPSCQQEVRDHLAGCAGCRDELQRLRMACSAFGGLATERISPDWQRKLKAASAVSPSSDRRRLPWALALAASLAVVLWAGLRPENLPGSGDQMIGTELMAQQEALNGVQPGLLISVPSSAVPCLDPADTTFDTACYSGTPAALKI